MDEKTFWLEADQWAIIARFKIWGERLREDPRYFFENSSIEGNNIFVPIFGGRTESEDPNFWEAIRLYHEVVPQRQAKLSPKFEDFIESVITVLENDEFEDLHPVIELFLWDVVSPAYEYLLEALKHPSADVRLHVLAAFHYSKALPRWLIPYFGELLLSDPDPRVRKEAASKLGSIGSPAAAGYLVWALRHDPHPEVGIAAVWALSLLETSEHLLKYLPLVEQVSYFNCSAFQALSQFVRGYEHSFVTAKDWQLMLSSVKKLKSSLDESVLEALSWSDREKRSVFECCLVKLIRQGRLRVDLKRWDLNSEESHIVKRSNLLLEGETPQLQRIWQCFCRSYGCPKELDSLPGPGPSIRIVLPKPKLFKDPKPKPLAVFTDGRVNLLMCFLDDYGGLGLWGVPIWELERFWGHLPSRDSFWNYQEPPFYVQILRGFRGQERIPCSSSIIGGAFSADGYVFAFAEKDCIRAFIFPPSQPLKRMKVQYPSSAILRGISLSPNGCYLAAWQRRKGSSEAMISIWNIESGQSPCLRRRGTVPCHEDKLNRFPFNPIVSFSPDSRLIAVPQLRSDFAGFEIYDVESGEPVHAVSKEGLAPLEARFSRDGKKLIGIVRGINPRLTEGVRPDLLESLRTKLVLDLSEPGTVVRLLVAWDLETGEMDTGVFHLDEALEGVKDFYFSPYGECITGLQEPNKMIRLFIPSQGLTLTLGSAPQKKLLGFSPDGLHLASVSLDDEIHIWELGSLLRL